MVHNPLYTKLFIYFMQLVRRQRDKKKLFRGITAVSIYSGSNFFVTSTNVLVIYLAEFPFLQSAPSFSIREQCDGPKSDIFPRAILKGWSELKCRWSFILSTVRAKPSKVYTNATCKLKQTLRLILMLLPRNSATMRIQPIEVVAVASGFAFIRTHQYCIARHWKKAQVFSPVPFTPMADLLTLLEFVSTALQGTEKDTWSCFQCPLLPWRS